MSADVSNAETCFEGFALIHTPTLSRKMRKPRFLAKKERRHQRSAARKLAADKAEVDSRQKIMNDIIFRNEPGIMCLPCEDKAYADDMWFSFDKNNGGKGVLGCAPPSHEKRASTRRVAARGFLVVPPSF